MENPFVLTISYWFNTNNDFYLFDGCEDWSLISYSAKTDNMEYITDEYMEEWVGREISRRNSLQYDDFTRAPRNGDDGGLLWKFNIYHPNSKKPIGKWTIDCVQLKNFYNLATIFK